MKKLNPRSLFFLFLSFAFFGCNKSIPKSETLKGIRIGEVTTLTGAEASFGISGHRGIELAIKEINDAGGIQGQTLELITLDDRGLPEEAAVAASKLISTHKVLALTGSLPSSRGIAIAPIAQKHQIVMVSSASTHPEVTRFGDYIFRVCFSDPFQGHVMAKFARDMLQLKRVAILKDMKSDYSIGLSQFFSETFKKSGGEVLLEQSYSSGDIDFKAQLTAIRAKAPDAIFIPGYYTEGALIARQARDLGMNVPLLGGDGWDSPQFLQIGRDAVNQTYFSSHYSSEDTSQIVQSFIRKFKEAYGILPDGLATLGYDGVHILASALKRAKSLEPKDVRDALKATEEFAGVTGKIRFDQNRNPVKPAVVMQVSGGKAHYMSTVHP